MARAAERLSGSTPTNDSDRLTRRTSDRGRALAVATVGALLLPAVLYLWFIHSYGVNWLRADQWYDIKLIRSSFSGHLTLSELWMQHAENRIFFQNLITLLLAHVTHFNVVVEEYLGAVMLIIATALIVFTHRRRSVSTPWLAYCPVALVMLSIAQWACALYGFELGWFLVMLTFTGSLFLLDRSALTGVAMAGAIAVAVVGSFSSLQGLFIWPAGLVLLLLRGRPLRHVVAWVVAACVTAIVYFYNWNTVGGSVSYGIAHPVETLRFFFFAVGDVLGAPLPDSPHTSDYAILVLGVLIVSAGIWALWIAGRRVDTTTGKPIGASLICFGFFFAAGIAGARTSFGLSAAGDSRYATFDLLILAGTYLVAIDQSRRPAAVKGRHRGMRSSALLGVAVGLIVLQLAVGTPEGLSNAASYRSFELTGQDVTVNIDRAPDGLVTNHLGTGYETPAFIRQMARFARGQRLSLFSTSALASFAKQGLIKDRAPPSVRLFKPKSGAVLSGGQWMVAGASAQFGLSRVEFYFAGNGRPETYICRATATPYGWLGAWNTETVPNGTYELLSVAYDSEGLATTSPSVRVEVENQG